VTRIFPKSKQSMRQDFIFIDLSALQLINMRLAQSSIEAYFLVRMSPEFLIVDGHSVIFAWPELRALHDRKTAIARDRLVKILTEYQDQSGINVVVVFDGRGPVITQENEPGGIQVFYSNTGHTADDIIERLVAKYGKIYPITVATCDLLEQQTAVAFGGNCISADGLRDLINGARTSFARELKRRNTR